MTVEILVKKLSECGYRFTLVGDNIVLKHIGMDDPKADEILPLVSELKRRTPELIQYLKGKLFTDNFQSGVNEQNIVKMKIECIVAHELLLNADEMYYRALDVCRRALEQHICARRNFDEARNRLRSEITCNEIYSYFRDLDVGKK